MHTHDNVCQTHELTYLIGHADTRLHLWKFTTWRFICRGLTVSPTQPPLNGIPKLPTITATPLAMNDKQHWEGTNSLWGHSRALEGVHASKGSWSSNLKRVCLRIFILHFPLSPCLWVSKWTEQDELQVLLTKQLFCECRKIGKVSPNPFYRSNDKAGL